MHVVHNLKYTIGNSAINIYKFWKVILEQDALAMKEYFHSDVYVKWQDINEHFIVGEFIQANCEY